MGRQILWLCYYIDMQTMTLDINNEVRESMRVSGFSVASDYVNNLMAADVLYKKSKKELYNLIQEGMDSGFVNWDKNLVDSLDKKYK